MDQVRTLPDVLAGCRDRGLHPLDTTSVEVGCPEAVFADESRIFRVYADAFRTLEYEEPFPVRVRCQAGNPRQKAASKGKVWWEKALWSMLPGTVREAQRKIPALAGGSFNDALIAFGSPGTSSSASCAGTWR